ncbi:neutral zinc metallopeptidase [Kribbella sp. NPDC026611]|uniref:neutral zinc metallopeptidase n=1 Tax=Kribbella sp. NPDC026611 TaxID=3154911 RepID=UPI0033E3B7AB
MPPQRPRKSGAGKALLVVGILGVLLVGGALIAVKLAHSGGPAVAEPAATTSATETVPTATSATKPGPFPTTSYATPSTTSYTPPPRPLSETNPAKYNATSRLYKTGVMRSVNCKLAKSSPGAGGSTALAYYKVVKACLDRAWPRAVAASGGRFRSPGMVIYAGTTSSPCGIDTNRSFYCGGNHVIYMNATYDIDFRSNPALARMNGAFTVAHEYAHSVQWMTGIGGAYTNLYYKSNSKALTYQLSRRLELQASCLGNVFLGANRNSLPISGYAYQMWLYDVNNSGDRPPYPPDHGTPKNHGMWSRAAFASRNPASCNTWSAGPAKVS